MIPNLNDIDIFISENKENIINDIKTIIDIPSVEAAPQPNAPFGVEVNRALVSTLEIAQNAGLESHNVDGYFGYADLKGESDLQIAAITHIDVVPAGNGWNSDPFNMIEKEGYLIGRGIADDKGPAILTIYAAKYFAQKGIKLPYTLRLMFGTNEESGMEGLKYYQQRYEDPAFCFTPDAQFPVCFAEKGLYGGVFKSQKLTGNIVSINGGVANNVVPDKASAVVRCNINSLPQSDGVTLNDMQNGCVEITTSGKGGHASTPDDTVNAILVLVDYLIKNSLCSNSEEEFCKMLSTLLCKTDGSNIGIASNDGIFSPLTCIGGVISMKDGIIEQTIDIRYPTSITAEEITAKMESLAATANAVYIASRAEKPFVTSESSPMVQALVSAYNDVSNTNEKPLTMGGGTYARHFTSAVSFGIEEPNEVFPEWVGEIHGANEGASIKTLLNSLKLFIVGIERLMEIDFSKV